MEQFLFDFFLAIFCLCLSCLALPCISFLISHFAMSSSSSSSSSSSKPVKRSAEHASLSSQFANIGIGGIDGESSTGSKMECFTSLGSSSSTSSSYKPVAPPASSALASPLGAVFNYVVCLTTNSGFIPQSIYPNFDTAYEALASLIPGGDDRRHPYVTDHTILRVPCAIDIKNPRCNKPQEWWFEHFSQMDLDGRAVHRFDLFTRGDQISSERNGILAQLPGEKDAAFTKRVKKAAKDKVEETLRLNALLTDRVKQDC